MTDKGATVGGLTTAEARDLSARYPMVRGGGTCAAIGRTGTGPYICTRAAGHEGPHVAHVDGGPLGAVAVWLDGAAVRS